MKTLWWVTTSCTIVILACHGVVLVDSINPISQTTLPRMRRGHSPTELSGGVRQIKLMLNVMSLLAPKRQHNVTVTSDDDGYVSNVKEPSTNQQQYKGKELLSIKSSNSDGTSINGENEEFLLRKMVRWLTTTGTSPSSDQQQSEEEETTLQTNWASLARMLLLLREYETKIGIPTFGGPEQQRQVLSDITTNLYNSGAPSWALETVMERVAEGMTGGMGVQFMLLPHRCFIFYPAPHVTTTAPMSSYSSSSSSHSSSSRNSKLPEPPAQSTIEMIKLRPGYHISRLGAVEQVAARLASFASTTKSAQRFTAAPVRIPTPEALAHAQERALKSVTHYLQTNQPSPKELAQEILNLASSTHGLFFVLNSSQLRQGPIIHATTGSGNSFWNVPTSTRDVFARLAVDEASQAMDQIRHETRKQLYPLPMLHLFRFMSSAGACALWFGGSWWDMVVSGILAVSVAYIDAFPSLALEERILTEVVASWFVGLVAGAMAILWPNKFCFAAIAVPAVLELLQGFKVAYSVVEVMSKNIVTGAARLVEGILVTGLISYSLKFGLDVAVRILLGPSAPITPHDVYAKLFVWAHGGVSEKWFPLLITFAAAGWSGLFQPSYKDLPLMTWHGVFAFGLNWAGVPNFWAALCVTLSAGIISRSTGRDALGNTLGGLYALVPGAYMIRILLSPNRVGFIENVLLIAATIGLGGWAGTVLSSPTIMGKSSTGLQGWSFLGRRERKKQSQQAMLYF
jgi:uncharacterized membrane protein YjjB (DUF3815 family)